MAENATQYQCVQPPVRTRKPQRGQKYVWIYKDIIRDYTSRVGAPAMGVYNYILSFVDKKGESCFPAIGTIAEGCGLSLNTVRKYISELVEHSLIHVESRYDERGQQTSHRFTFLTPIESSPKKNEGGGAKFEPEVSSGFELFSRVQKPEFEEEILQLDDACLSPTQEAQPLSQAAADFPVAESEITEEKLVSQGGDEEDHIRPEEWAAIHSMLDPDFRPLVNLVPDLLEIEPTEAKPVESLLNPEELEFLTSIRDNARIRLNRERNSAKAGCGHLQL